MPLDVRLRPKDKPPKKAAAKQKPPKKGYKRSADEEDGAHDNAAKTLDGSGDGDHIWISESERLIHETNGDCEESNGIESSSSSYDSNLFGSDGDNIWPKKKKPIMWWPNARQL